ncbi:MAG: L,D-transpeptidase family protein, partial [Desulfofustis sp.]|nr:L,D-transpeptidase family protein [Desulfofustis sp.]
RETGGKPLWVSAAGPGPAAGVIIDRLRRCHLDGLEPEEYEVSLLESLWTANRPDDLARLDTLLTYNLVKYIHDISFGQLKLHLADPELFAEAGNTGFDPVQSVRIARSVADLGAYLDSLPPQHRYYATLKEALAHFRELALTADWPNIPSGPLIRPGDSDHRLAAIISRLTATDSIEGVYTDAPERYHEPLVTAVRAFQRRHGLETDGIIGPQTLAMLNRTPAELAAIIRANLARWRWQDHHLSDTYLMVNIAAFHLKAVRENQVVHELPVIVGKFQHQTPVFSDSIRYLDFNPFWNVTPSIARNEDLPALRKDPRHLVDRHIRLFSSWQPDAHELDSTAIDWHNVSRSQMSRYLLRQDPGPWNALGRVKFVFPNHHNVYLHDTPARDLFQQTSRSFSHGCIRVSQPLLLALFCLQLNDETWTISAIEDIVASGRRKVISLRKHLPIYLTYQTAWVDKGGMIHFNADIYQRDTKLLQVLESR